MAERMVKPFMELRATLDATEYAAQIAENLGWVKVASGLRKFGWSEPSDDLIGRIERALMWPGHWKESKLRLIAARDALTILTVPIGVEILPYCLDLEMIIDPKIFIPASVRAWLDGPSLRALANHPTLGWIGVVSNDHTQSVDVVHLTNGVQK